MNIGGLELHPAGHIVPPILRGQRDSLSEDLFDYGFEPGSIVLSHDGKVVWGNHLLEAAELKGLDPTPAIVRLPKNVNECEEVVKRLRSGPHLSPSQRAAAAIIYEHESEDWAGAHKKRLNAANQARSTKMKGNKNAFKR